MVGVPNTSRPGQENDTDDAGKPECRLSGSDGNVFSIMGCVTKALRRAGLPERATEFTNRAFEAGRYDEVLRLCFEYVDVT